MLNHILKRFILLIITIIGVSIIVFFIIHMIPGDPITFMFGKSPNQELIEKVRQNYNLDKPIIVQYLLWIRNVSKLDFGTSIMTDLPVAELVFERIGRTFILASGAVIFALILAIPVGIISAYKHNSFLDFNITTLSLIFLSIPEFWIGIFLIFIFAIFLGVLPSSGYVFPNEDFIGFLKILILPVISLGVAQFAIFTRMLRATMIEGLQQDYTKLERAYGIKETKILYVYVFRNAIVPVITLVGISFGYLLGGAIVIERVFNYPGLGMLLWKSLGERDYPVIQGCIIIFSLMFIIVNFIVDILYGFINPKIRYR